MSVIDGVELRALKRLAAEGARGLPLPSRSDIYGVFTRGDRRRRPLARLPRERVDALVSSGVLKREPNDDGVDVTPEGRLMLRRHGVRGSDPFRGQHMELAEAADPDATSGRGEETRLVNVAESPLSWLARRTDASGRAYVSARELLAGERLQKDFHLARYIGRVTSDWAAPPSARGRGGRGPSLDANEAMLDARRRIADAMRAVGSDLGAVLSAVCLEGCGLEEIERRFDWPRRSARIGLRLALGRLADHYGYARED